MPLESHFAAIEARIGYRFRDRGMLEHALTHKSRTAEDPSGGVADNESLEFLGDAVLGFVAADVLYRDFPQYTEGPKSKAKAALVSTTALAGMSRALGLGDALLLGRGEEKTGGRTKQALLADVFEAVIAAIYLDGGIEPARAFVERQIRPLLADVRRSPVFGRDHKSALQERLQGAGPIAARPTASPPKAAPTTRRCSTSTSHRRPGGGDGDGADEEGRRAGSRQTRARRWRSSAASRARTQRLAAAAAARHAEGRYEQVAIRRSRPSTLAISPSR